MVEYIADKWEIDANLLHDTVAWPSIAKARKSAGAISHRARVVVGRVLSVRGGMLPRHLFRFEFRISNFEFKIQKFTARTGGYRSLASTVPLFDSIHSSLYHVILKEASL
jgi:hypothetical protein